MVMNGQLGLTLPIVRWRKAIRLEDVSIDSRWKATNVKIAMKVDLCQNSQRLPLKLALQLRGHG
jgi:hypothetical protein